MGNIVFIGGIHGSGKGTICKNICAKKKYIHLTASELLNWEDISEKTNKLVKNIDRTQERLLSGLSKAIEKDKLYLLDGHFCLFDKKGEISKVPETTFESIAPKLIAVLNEDVQLIKERLEKRDNKPYDFNVLKQMQEAEIAYSKEIAKKLGVKHFEISSSNYNNLLENM
jgi:adenylate kinase